MFIRSLAVSRLCLIFLFFAAPKLSAAECVNPDKVFQTLGELHQALLCLERKIATGGGAADTVLVNYLPELPKPTVSKQAFAGEVKFGLKQCVRRGAGIRCEFTVRNDGTDTKVTLHRGGTFAVDEFGRRYDRPELLIGGQSKPQLLVTKVPVEVSVSFNDVADNSTRLARFDLIVHANRNHTMTFRDVALR